MALFLWLIILLSIAWGLADYQLQSRIEREPPPTPVTRPVPAVPPKVDVAPALDGAPGSVPPADSTEPVPDAERSTTVQGTPPAPPMPERAQE